ncbi:uncharacterized protein LOC123398693 [Hordeum vulgare subsp. vulgare]|uniref:uncharacterized protein LOC123398693 n=1 Tax=Hordeum vulgare subsp. vulgare TaxID=112509 RepID=UPI001D1A58F5|nr:uncharacterized protein LOC123398693 [Hordeum vulgare subsp. vulgare]
MDTSFGEEERWAAANAEKNAAEEIATIAEENAFETLSEFEAMAYEGFEALRDDEEALVPFRIVEPGKWEASCVTDNDIQELKRAGYLSANEVHHAPEKGQVIPTPKQGERVVFIPNFIWGLGFLLHPFPCHAPFHCFLRRSFSSLLASLPPRHRGTSVYRGVREGTSGIFYAEIRSDDMRLGLGMFDTVDDAVRAYDPAAWCLNRPRRDMDFPEVMTREWAQRLAPPPRVVIEEDRRQNRRWDRRLGIAEMDEHAMAAWRQEFLHDVLDERAFFAQRKAERRAKRAAYREDRRTRKQAALFNMELKEASTWSSDDDRWAKDFIRMEELDTSASEENDEE